MELSLKITLFNRLILAADAQANLAEYYTIDSWDEQGQPTAYTWVNVDMTEPTQEQLDAENLVYQEELLEERIRPVIGTILLRLEPTIDFYPLYERGQKYSEAKWQDDLMNEQNATLRAEYQGRIDAMNDTKAPIDTRITELEAILEADRTEEEQQELDDLLLQQAQLQTQIDEDQAAMDAITDVTPGPRPTWEAVKTEFAAYEAELAAAAAALDAEEAELQAMNLGEVLMSLIGPDVRYWFEGRQLYDNLIISEGEKPTLQAIRDEWVVLEPVLQAQQARLAKKVGGSQVRLICDSLLDLVAGNNLEKSLTIAQIDQMETDYADILAALKNYRPDKAFALITAMTPDGTLVTQEDKDEYLAEFAAFGIQ